MENFANSSEYKEYVQQFEYIFDEKYFKKKLMKFQSIRIIKYH